MGKKRQLKLISKAAKALPAVLTTAKRSERMSSREARELGIKNKDGKLAADSDRMVNVIKHVREPLNHRKEMKKLYGKQGMKGVFAYAKSVIDFVNKKDKPSADTI